MLCTVGLDGAKKLTYTFTAFLSKKKCFRLLLCAVKEELSTPGSCWLPEMQQSAARRVVFCGPTTRSWIGASRERDHLLLANESTKGREGFG